MGSHWSMLRTEVSWSNFHYLCYSFGDEGGSFERYSREISWKRLTQAGIIIDSMGDRESKDLEGLVFGLDSCNGMLLMQPALWGGRRECQPEVVPSGGTQEKRGHTIKSIFAGYKKFRELCLVASLFCHGGAEPSAERGTGGNVDALNVEGSVPLVLLTWCRMEPEEGLRLVVVWGGATLTFSGSLSSLWPPGTWLIPHWIAIDVFLVFFSTRWYDAWRWAQQFFISGSSLPLCPVFKNALKFCWMMGYINREEFRQKAGRLGVGLALKLFYVVIKRSGFDDGSGFLKDSKG